MRVVIARERDRGRQVFAASDKNLGYNITSIDLSLCLIEVKGIGGATGQSWNEPHVAEDRCNCCTSSPTAATRSRHKSQSATLPSCPGARSPILPLGECADEAGERVT